MQGYLKIFQLFIKKEKMTFLQTLNQNYQTPQMIYHNVLLYITISLLVTTIFIISQQIIMMVVLEMRNNMRVSVSPVLKHQ